MKKNLLLSVFLSTTLLGSALAAAPSPVFTGFFIGVGPTFSLGKVKLKGNNFSKTVSDNGLGINGFVGYGTVIYEGFYLGAEASLGEDGSFFNKSALNYQLKSKSRFTCNAAARMGYAVSDFLAYMKIGYEERPKVAVNNLSTGSTLFKVNRNGFLLGAGVDYVLTKSVFLRGEYNYNFGSLKKPLNVGVSFRTSTQTLLIGAGYRY